MLLLLLLMLLFQMVMMTEAVKGLRAALSNDIRDKQKDEQMERDKVGTCGDSSSS